MKEVQSAQDLVDSLLNADNKLVIVDFYSPGCGGCKALHPKFAELNPDVLFLQVNYEEHKSMCYSLNVHVLPFFRFYNLKQMLVPASDDVAEATPISPMFSPTRVLKGSEDKVFSKL
ncbi:thioredoxin-like 1-2, chloroplastic isoform X1 [Dioscorea cayenensis subsp. rotundata]|uniref:Thioredoxin-like 1-2, chloroplastic isoform X1 n=1 Tax=Dioscorea cayennensis subsp. rotundata TaxID=55577 RepID=A0AB40ARG8_DIOCR|nr:thioredoxin-like 1-2, chloroplastic isoform X1 [Dioscorea cayenensis subsp. rotundata]